MTRILLIGLGRWGRNHLRVLRSLPVELFVSDTQPTQLQAARSAGIADDHLSSDHQDFADCVDAVVVATPAQSHFSLCKEFIQRGKDVFVEKPVTLVVSEAKELVELASGSKRIVQVGHILRFDTASSWLRQSIQSEAFGRLHMLRGNFSGFKRPRSDSGMLFADAIHFVDLCNFLLGSTPVCVTAVAHDFLGRGMEDACLLSLEYALPRGIVWGVVEANYFSPGKNRELMVTGSEMTALCDFNVAQYKIRTFANKHTRNGGHFVAEEGVRHQIECAPEEPLLAEMRAFVNSVKTRQAPLADARAGYDAVRVLEAAMESAKTGRTVAMR